MRKVFIILTFLAVIISCEYDAQCVPSCSIYAVSPITYSVFPATGTTLSLFDDDISGTIPIGFTFTFFCNSYSSLLVCSNGWLTFDLTNSNPSYPGQSIPALLTPNDFVAFDWTDLDPSSGGIITYTTIGIAPNRRFVLTYSNVPCYGSSILNTCQTILFETSNIIEIHCAQIGNNGSTCTQGIENSNGSSGQWRPNANASYWTVSTPDAYRFELGALPMPPTAISGSTLLCGGTAETYTATNMTGATSYSWLFPSAWIGTSSVSAVNATAGVSGNLSVTATYTCGTSLPTTLSVTTLSAPVLSISSSSAIICSGQSLTINGSGPGVINYTLDPIGVTGSPPFLVNPAVTTIFTLFGENSAGCVSNNSASITVTVKTSPTVQVNNGFICLGEPFTIVPSGAETYNYSSLFATITPTSVGVHTILVVGTNTSTGCSSDVAISTITVNSLPNVNLNSNRQIICLKETTTLSVSGASTYTWTSNASNATNLVVNPLTTTVYTVTGTDAGCSKSATIAITVNACIGIGELNNESNRIQIYPNPSSGFVKLETPKSISIAIYDTNGKLIYSEKVNAGNHTIDLNSFANGNYFLKTTDGLKTETNVILKQ